MHSMLRNSACAPIAVIGMACRFPGADSPAVFWRNLRDGVCSIRDYPAPPWMPETQRLHLGRIEGIELFAADFFGFDDEEARLIDPQQRLMLELAYQALDDAGYSGARMPAQRKVGVYVGANYNAYLERINQRRGQGGFPSVRHPQLLPNNLLNVIAGRISQRLDLKGPALNLDSACASSLVALHYACADLRSGECEIALAGGASLSAEPSTYQLMHQTGSVSNDSVCRVFDEAASGLVYGEGLGLVVLKPLDKALADGDHITAVISATAFNNDGRSMGIMAPTLEGQEAMLREALARAGLSPSQVSYIEAHGTGTPVGDAVEVHALTNVYGAPPLGAYCGIGSVKTNIGHPMSAAGIAGLIKLLLSFRHELLPPTLNLHKAHPNLRLEHTPFWPVLSATPWPRGDTPRHAGINSFGFGGANAHAIVSDAPLPAPRAPSVSTHHLLCLSARNVEELLALRSRLVERLRQQPEVSVLDLSYTCCAGRAAFQRRECLVVSSVQDAIDQLQYGARGLADGAPAEALTLAAQGQRWVRGEETIDWVEHFRGRGARVLPLPCYPFTRRAFWLPGESPREQSLPETVGTKLPRAQAVPAARDISTAGPTLPVPTARSPGAELPTVATAASSFPASNLPGEDLIAGWIEDALVSDGLPPCADRTTNFAQRGADSLVAAVACRALSEHLGVDVPMALFFEYTSVERLARRLTQLHGPRIEQVLAAAQTQARSVSTPPTPGPVTGSARHDALPVWPRR